MASTTEPKGEPKEVAEDVSSETLKYKTWVLKVSIHCGACSKKVIKILKKIDGVYKTEVDILLQKVTVTGNVEVETLIKKLTQKTAKHVELWPDLQKPNSKDKKPSNPKSKDPDDIAEETNHGGSGGGGGDMKKEKEKVKVEVDQAQESGGSNKNFEVGSSSNSKNVEDKPHEGGGGSGGGGGELKEAKTGIMASQSTPVVAENSGGGESEAVGEKSSGGGKKKKKGQNNVNAAEGELRADALPSTESAPVHNGSQPQPQPQPHVPNLQSPIQVLPNHGLPPQQHSPLPQQVYQYPYHPRQPQQYYTPPVHAMNYNAAHPSISYGASRYATQPLYSQSHAYAHWGLGGTQVEPPLYHLENHPPQSSPPPPPYYPPHPYYSFQPSYSDSFTLFSDENPNGCQIM